MDKIIASVWVKFCTLPVYLLSFIFPSLKRIMAEDGLPIIIISTVSCALLALIINILLDRAYSWKLGIAFYVFEFCGLLIWNFFWLSLHGDSQNKNMNRSS